MYVAVTNEIEAEKEEEAKALEKVSNRKPAPRPKGAPNWTKRVPRKKESSAIEDPQNTTKVVIDEGHADPQRKGLKRKHDAPSKVKLQEANEEQAPPKAKKAKKEKQDKKQKKEGKEANEEQAPSKGKGGKEGEERAQAEGTF